MNDELAKLTGSFINAIAIGITVVGGLGPLVNSMYTNSVATPIWGLTLLSMFCFVTGFAIHRFARHVLKRELMK